MARVAQAAGMAPSTLYDLERGDSAGTTRLGLIAAFLAVNPLYLQTGRGPIELSGDAATASEPDWTSVTAYAQGVGLGAGTEAQEYAETHALKFKATSLSRKNLQPRNLAVFYGDGDSMEPRIKAGDAILFDTSDTNPVDGKVFIVEYRGEIYAKRAEQLERTWYFRSDNPAGDHSWGKGKRMDNPRDPIRVIGRVRWIGSWEA